MEVPRYPFNVVTNVYEEGNRLLGCSAKGAADTGG